MALAPSSYAILGMLSLAPMSGYELLTNVGKTIAHFWSMSKSQTYTELARLESVGLIAGTDVPQDSAPDKRTYRITAEGERVLDDWLAESFLEESKVRSLLLLKVFFAYRMDPEVFIETIERHRADAERGHQHLASIVELLDGLPETFYPRATALYGMRSAEAFMGWADEVLADIPAKRKEPVPPDVAEGVARDILATTPARPVAKRRKRT